MMQRSPVSGVATFAASVLLVRLLAAAYRIFLPGLLGGGAEAAVAVGLFGIGFAFYQVASSIGNTGLAQLVAGEGHAVHDRADLTGFFNGLWKSAWMVAAFVLAGA